MQYIGQQEQLHTELGPVFTRLKMWPYKQFYSLKLCLAVPTHNEKEKYNEALYSHGPQGLSCQIASWPQNHPKYFQNKMHPHQKVVLITRMHHKKLPGTCVFRRLRFHQHSQTYISLNKASNFQRANISFVFHKIWLYLKIRTD